MQALSHFKVISAIGVFVSLAFLLFSTASTVMMSYWWDRYLWYLRQYGFATIPAQPAILMPMILHAMHGGLALNELVYLSARSLRDASHLDRRLKDGFGDKVKVNGFIENCGQF
ncbi:hypothetical protein BV898_12149 [Hypsibius exemplaris]|uniref:Uncharacterized protein n=1 Tax=Hypsibius exemplaris TaxID=2072580 RepID=A0A1W0WEH1_HYPEX|nr:hypothetical protein BV898_12149 [Hypsibius exemplaris]